MSSVGRAFAGWRNATGTFERNRVPESARQIRHRRHFVTGVGRSQVDHLDAVARWLDEDLPETSESYDAWRVTYNETIAGTDEPLAVEWSHLRRAFPGLTTADIIAAARGEVDEVARLGRERAEERLRQYPNALGLVGARTAAALLGVTQTVVLNAARKEQEGFPAVVAELAGGFMLYETDVRAYAAGRPAPQRKPRELQGQVLGRGEVRDLLGMTHPHMRNARDRQAWHLVPEPAGRAGNRDYWLRSDVEAWMAAHPGRVRPRSGAAKAPGT